MRFEDELTLSFYENVYAIDNEKNVWIVKHIETGVLYVKKDIDEYAINVYKELQKNIYEGVPEIEHIIEDNDHLIVIEQYINGRTLSSLLTDQKLGPLPCLQVTINLCDILKPLHDHNPPLIHRDIKPENILIDSEGKVWLVDFNASKLFDPSKQKDTSLIGTIGYAAPEQYGFAQSDPRTDVYQLGVLTQIIIEENSEADDALKSLIAPLINRCCQMDPDDRYKDAGELGRQLENVRKKYAESKKPSDQAKAQKNESRHNSAPNSATWKIPGFRSGKRWVSILAGIGYGLLLLLAFTNKDGELVHGKIDPNSVQASIALLAAILVIGDWHGCKAMLPLAKSNNPTISIIGRILWGIVAFLFFAFLSALYEMLTGQLQ